MIYPEEIVARATELAIHAPGSSQLSFLDSATVSALVNCFKPFVPNTFQKEH